MELTVTAASPTQLTIALGTVVRWHDTAGAPHVLAFTAAPGKAPPDLRIAGDATGDVAFGTSGRYTYRCTIHPSITGTVTVE